MCLFTTNLRITSLFPDFQGTVVQFINGALEASASTFLIAKFLYEYFEIEPSVFWWIWFVLGVLIVGLRTGFLMPRVQVRDKEEVSKEEISMIDQANDSTKTP